MDSLFKIEPLLSLKEEGTITCTLKLPESLESQQHPIHSWDFGENFPNEIEPALDSNDKVYKLNFPVYSISGDNLLVSIDENFLNVSPIFSNKISEKLVSSLKNDLDIVLVGCSDRVQECKVTTDRSCTLQPPEFVSGFIGSLVSAMARNSNASFTAVIAPSEGPQGFEKLSITTMDSLIQTCSEFLSIDHKLYSAEVHKRWKLDGRASGAQTGLYL